MELPAAVGSALSRAYPDYPRFARYLGIGVLTTLFDWTIFYLLTAAAGIFYMPALAGSYIASTVISFFLNRRYTFHNRHKKIHVQLASFGAVAVAGLAINEIIVYGLVRYAFGGGSPAWLMTARVIATAIVFGWNFAINKRITFRVFQ